MRLDEAIRIARKTMADTGKIKLNTEKKLYEPIADADELQEIADAYNTLADFHESAAKFDDFSQKRSK